MFHITENLRDAHGHYIDSTITRASVIVGAFGSALDAAYQQNVCDTDIDSSRRKKADYSDDVKAFCREYRQDKLFDNVPGRFHSAFPSFQAKICIKNPQQLKERLIRYSKLLDLTRLHWQL